jgi:hypothetical protein
MRFFVLLSIVVAIIACNTSSSKYYFTRTYESIVQSIFSFFKVMIVIVFLLISGYLACMLLYLIHTYQSTIFPIQVATNINLWHSESVPGDHGEGISELQNLFIDQVPEEVPEFTIDPSFGRLRRPRMGFTLLNDRAAEAAIHSENIIRDKINEALLAASIIAQEEQEFSTPSPSPRIVITRRHSGTQTDIDWNTGGGHKKPDIIKTRGMEKSVNLAKSDFSFNSTMHAIVRQHVAGFSNLTLHQFPRGLTKPCLSCDGMFLETYIRLIGISCEVSATRAT